MSDLKMLTKIALLAYGIVNLLFGIMYVLMAETLIASMAPPGWELNVFHPKVLGGFLVIIGVFCFLMLLNKNWDWVNIKVGASIQACREEYWNSENSLKESVNYQDNAFFPFCGYILC